MQDMLLPTPAQGKAIRQIAECALQNRAAGFSHRTNQDRFETPASEPTLSASGARIRLRLRCQGKITSSAAAELVSVLRHPITWGGMRHHSTTFSFGQVPNSNKNASAQLYLQPTVLKYRCRNRRPSGEERPGPSQACGCRSFPYSDLNLLLTLTSASRSAAAQRAAPRTEAPRSWAARSRVARGKGTEAQSLVETRYLY